jgi:hypothetical protein
MFGKKKSSASPLVLSAEKFDTLIGPRCEMHGRILATDSLRLDGTVVGHIEAHSDLPITVVIGASGVVQGDVRAHGKAKSGLIERQFMLSLVQTGDGLPIDHQVHPGNTAEARTLLPMIRALVARYPLKRVVLVADRGLPAAIYGTSAARFCSAARANAAAMRSRC